MSIKKLAGQTAIYGMSSVIGRMLYALLVPLYTNLSDLITDSDYGIVTDIYVTMAILMVFFTYRLEVAYFRFGAEPEEAKPAFRNALSSHVLTTLVLVLLFILAAPYLASWKNYPEYTRLLYWAAIIVGIDTLSEVPKARLRLEQRPLRFASVQLAGIGLNLGLNLFFLLFCPYALEAESWQWAQPYIDRIFVPERAIEYIFISNIAGSLLSFLLLLPLWKDFRFQLSLAYWKKMMRFSAPLIIVGLSFVINEMLDRFLLPLLSEGSAEEKLAVLGIYGANYKLATFIALFTQAFRYGAEPFFFQKRYDANSKELYAKIARYFTLVGVFGFLSISLCIPLVRMTRFIGPDYWSGLHVAPILLAANLMLGIYYNFSVWYKLKDKTIWGAYISVGGALLTILLNLWWIPIFSFTGCAWATLICYSCMTIASYYFGQRHYRIPYPIARMLEYLGSALAIYLISLLWPAWPDGILLAANFMLLIAWIIYIWWRENGLKKILIKSTTN